ncbi:MAG: pitrilysin family protein [Planctomycetota bacterium]
MPTITDSPVTTTHLKNGLTIVCQPMPWLRTAAYTMWLPGGLVSEVPLGEWGSLDGSIASDNSSATKSYDAETDPHAGLASLTCEMVQRGAGPYSSRDLVSVEDNLGIDASVSASTSVVTFSGNMPAESISDAMGILAELVRRPHLPGDQVDDAKMMLYQERMASLDEPTSRLMKHLRLAQFGNPAGRSGSVNPVSLETLSIDSVREFYQSNYHCGGGLLAIAGQIDPQAITQQVEQLFGDWRSGDPIPLEKTYPTEGNHHLHADSSQTHIGFAFDSIPYGHEDYFVMRAGIGILSDGMSSRLFDRVREQRGLCYSVWASTTSFRGFGGVMGYAGTTPARAQETLDVTLHEIRHLADDLTTDELDRWKTRIESNLIMEQESAGSRAGSLASDQFQIGRVMSTEELESAIEAITLDQVRDYWHAHSPEHFRIVTVGPEPLQTT